MVVIYKSRQGFIEGLKTSVYRQFEAFVCMLIFSKFFFCSTVVGAELSFEGAFESPRKKRI